MIDPTFHIQRPRSANKKFQCLYRAGVISAVYVGPMGLSISKWFPAIVKPVYEFVAFPCPSPRPL